MKKRFMIDSKKLTKFYYSAEWKQLCNWVRDCYLEQCSSCKSKEDLKFCHKTSIYNNPRMALMFGNVVFLCETCRKKPFKSYKTYKTTGATAPSLADRRALAEQYKKFFSFDLYNMKNEYCTPAQRQFMKDNSIKCYGNTSKFEAMQKIKAFKEKKPIRTTIKVKKVSSSPKTILRKKLIESDTSSRGDHGNSDRGL